MAKSNDKGSKGSSKPATGKTPAKTPPKGGKTTAKDTKKGGGKK